MKPPMLLDLLGPTLLAALGLLATGEAPGRPSGRLRRAKMIAPKYRTELLGP
jgi:hypothetical protein